MFGVTDNQLQTELTGDLTAAIDNVGLAIDEAATPVCGLGDIDLGTDAVTLAEMEMSRPPARIARNEYRTELTVQLVCESTSKEA